VVTDSRRWSTRAPHRGARVPRRTCARAIRLSWRPGLSPIRPSLRAAAS